VSASVDVHGRVTLRRFAAFILEESPDEDLFDRPPAGCRHCRLVSDAAYRSVVDKFGERGVMDLIGLTGYYTMLAMVLNVTRVPLPEGTAPPLPALK
jgi:4-carboxymuconolactone decarboxylase